MDSILFSFIFHVIYSTYNIVQFTKICRVAMQAKELSVFSIYEFHRKKDIFKSITEMMKNIVKLLVKFYVEKK